MSQLAIAREYVEAGISVIPIRLDGSKAPAIASWAEYQTRLPTDDELKVLFSDPIGIAVICGLVSGCLEVIDFDHNADAVFPAWVDKLPRDIRAKLTVVETGGLGYHVYYRSESVCGNEKIAKTRDGSETIIETRGHGGYVVGVGSPIDVHSSGNPYVQVRGEVLPALPVMTKQQRETLWAAARSFDERDRSEVVAEYARRVMPKVSDEVDTSTPWGDFDVRASWADILSPHGWNSANGEVWARPGKKHGTSAKVVIANNGCEVLTVFSGNAGPLAPSTGSYRTWGKFSAYAALNHNGDSSAAAIEIRREGYGDGRTAA